MGRREDNAILLRPVGDFGSRKTRCYLLFNRPTIHSSFISPRSQWVPLMVLEFLCPGCEKKYTVDEALSGKQVRCKACDTIMRVPQAAPVKPVAPDLFGMGDDDTTEEVAGNRRGRSSTSARKHAARRSRRKQRRADLDLYRRRRGSLFLVLVIGIIATRGSKPIDEPGPDGAEVAQTGVAKKRVPRVGPPWNLKADPGPEPFKLGAEVFEWTVEIPEAFSQEAIVYPSTSSPFVLLGGNDAPNHKRELWDLRGPTLVSVLSGRHATRQN